MATSSTELEVYRPAAYCIVSRGLSRGKAADNFVKFGHEVFEIRELGQTDVQTR